MADPQRPGIATANDYATIEAGDWEFYYGYEYPQLLGVDDEDDTWGFIAAQGDVPLFHVAHGPGWPARFNTGECLLYGIGLWLAAREEPRPAVVEPLFTGERPTTRYASAAAPAYYGSQADRAAMREGPGKSNSGRPADAGPAV